MLQHDLKNMSYVWWTLYYGSGNQTFLFVYQY